MKRCLELAKLGLGQVATNPMVGCVIVHNGVIIGEGYHEGFGGAHAEVNAINAVGDASLLPQSILYVNLEPCSHVGKTPACTGKIIQSKIGRVVIGCRDTNKEVSGGGVAILSRHGCEVEFSEMEAECRDLNRRFFTFHKEKRPYVILKWAESSDGYIAPEGGQQKWITGEESKQLVHKWRTEEQAIMVGTNTVLIDNPELTARLWEGNNPVRVAIDNHGRIPATAKILNSEAATLIYGARKTGSPSATFVSVNTEGDQLNAILTDLYNREIMSVIVEGGQQLLNSFIVNGIWDEARVFTGEINFSNGLKAPQLKMSPVGEKLIGPDRLRLFYNKS